MSVILAYTLPWRGHVFPLVPVLLELKRRGHDVVLASHPKACAFLEDEGLRMVSTTLDVDDGQMRHGAQCQSSGHEHADGSHGARCAEEMAERQRALSRELGMPGAMELQSLISRLQPDCLLIDPLIWGAMIAAEASGLPWAAAAHSCVLIPSKGVRAIGPGYAPARAWRDRLLLYFLGRQRALINDQLFLLEINSVRGQFSLEMLKHARDAYQRAPLTLAFTAEPFEYPRTDWHPSVRFIGPALWEPKGMPLEWTRELGERPLLLISTSSAEQDDQGLVPLAIDALRHEGWQLVATLASTTGVSESTANVRVENYVPHGQILPYANCVVCHAGYGITQKALAAGVPVVAIPYGRDQFEVARRVEVARAGVRLPASFLTPERLKWAVQEAISMRAGAQRIAECFCQAGGTTVAANSVEQIIQRSARHSRAKSHDSPAAAPSARPAHTS